MLNKFTDVGKVSNLLYHGTRRLSFVLLPPATLCPSRFDKGMGSNALLAASAPFTVQDKCVLEADEACYVLSIESAMPIFAVRG